MIKFDFSGIKNTLMSNTLLSFSFNFNRAKKDEAIAVNNDVVIEEVKKYTDYKTTLYGDEIDIVGKINDDIIVYLFIEKEKDSSAWNLVVPVIIEKSTNRIIQFGSGWFALEGCGGGLGNTSSLIYNLKKHIEKGYKVSILPKVIDNKLLYDYEYCDSNINLSDLLENSIDLINYRKDAFKWIYKQYQELLQKHKIE